MTDMAQRRALVVAAGESVRLGLNHGTTGNLSVRSPGGFLIIPTGSRCDRITAADLVAMDLDGNVRGGGGAPSSEWRLHRDLYQARPDVGGVVHSHPVFATTLACHRMHLPAVHYMIAVTGASSVQCARYATFGTAELSDAVLEAIEAARLPDALLRKKLDRLAARLRAAAKDLPIDELQRREKRYRALFPLPGDPWRGD